MSLNHIQVPLPRLRQQTGGIALLFILTVVVVLSAVELSEQAYLTRWMRNHDMGYSGGFSIRFDLEPLKTSWLPTLLYRGPHHQLAVAASIVNIVTSVLVMELFILSCRIQKSFGQHWILLAIFIPTLTFITTALLYNFIEHGITGRLDTYMLSQYASPTGYAPYGANWLDFESWSCGLLSTSLVDQRGLWEYNCKQSQLGRWLLLPTWFAIFAAIPVSWIAFRGLPAWRGNNEDEFAVESGEGRVRLP